MDDNFTMIRHRPKILPGLAVCLLIQACGTTEDYALIERLPRELSDPSPVPDTANLGTAPRGCGFAGTWEFSESVGESSIVSGYIIFEVMLNSKSAPYSLNSVNGVIDWLFQTISAAPRNYYASLYFSRLIKSEQESISTTAYFLSKNGGYDSVPVSFVLEQNGVELHFSYRSVGGKIYSMVAERVRSLPCDTPIDYITRIKQELEKRTDIDLRADGPSDGDGDTPLGRFYLPDELKKGLRDLGPMNPDSE